MVAAAASAIGLLPVRMLERPPQAWQPSIFLAFVGLISLAASVHGVRALRRRAARPHVADYALPVLLAAASLAMGAWSHGNGFVLGLVFAALGLLLAVPELRVLVSPPAGAGWWVGEHLVGMMVASISTLTAFLVVNAARALGPYSFVLWIAPTVMLVPVMIRMKRRFVPRRAPPGTAALE